MGIVTAVWEKWIEFRHEWKNITISLLISPLLYLIAFGLGVGSGRFINGVPYINYLVPGVIALSTMNTGFSATSTYLNIQKMYDRSLDQVLASPTPIWQYVFGQMLGGGLRGVYAGVLISIVSAFFGVIVPLSPSFFFIMLLNGMIFSAFGIFAAMNSKDHAQVARYSTYLILPMTFLCNTFFSLDKFPNWAAIVIKCLPLTHASAALRSLTFHSGSILLNMMVLFVYAGLFYAASCICVYRIREI